MKAIITNRFGKFTLDISNRLYANFSNLEHIKCTEPSSGREVILYKNIITKSTIEKVNDTLHKDS